MTCPVFIVNRNRVSGLRRLVPWLVDAGVTDITILDNDSTFPPLLDYYKTVPARVRRLGGNYGPWVFWNQRMENNVSTNYVMTDSDVAPTDYCPKDLMERLEETLRLFPDATKAGPGLRIDNLPEHYALRREVVEHETQFWNRKAGDGCFYAGIDSTFAMYRPRMEFTNDMDRNIRLDAPYLFEHLPWYENTAAPSEEDQFYRSTIDHSFAIYWSKR